jgi:hypothetical protein
MRLVMTAAERKEVIHERLRSYPLYQAAREERRRKDRDRKRAAPGDRETAASRFWIA